MKKLVVIFMWFNFLLGCASAPTGPGFDQIKTPEPTDGNAVAVFFRDYAEPTGPAGTILINGEEKHKLPQKSFAISELPLGIHKLKLKWPGISGMPGWEGDVNFSESKTYYFQLTGVSAMFVFHSKLSEIDEPLAKVALRSCCKLVSEQKDMVALQTDAEKLSKPELTHSEKKMFFANVKEKMLPEEVISLIGEPDKISSKSTGKQWIPFYFAPDTRRVNWSYTGIGFVNFTQNEYTGSLRVVKVIYDESAP